MITKIYLIIFFLFITINAFGVQRFPPPEFESGYELPKTTVPNPRAEFYEYLDVLILIISLLLSSYLALKKRSRRGIFVMGIFSLIYFGFWRKGCVCSIGAIQNVTLALFDNSYTIPITAIAFFILPLISTLLFGRTFCASVCPLGAIQDIMVMRPIKVPMWTEYILSLFAYVYLGLSVLFAATGSAFVICRYDPFVAFFRRTGTLNMLLLGTCLLVIGIFIGRPYCRYLCPYSVLLRFISSASKWHVSITPSKCIKCRLCEDSCPYNAIVKPIEEKERDRNKGKRALAFLFFLLPVFIVVGILIGIKLGTPLSKVNRNVTLSERIWMEETGVVKGTTESSDAFRGTGKLKEELYESALKINKKFTKGGGIFGGFMGMVIGSKMILLSIRRNRMNYEVNRAECISCGRCFAYCPIGKSKYSIENKE
ncbi:MAG: 4Fe-4S binding protein [bacterium]